MTDTNSPSVPAPVPSIWDQDLIFAALADPARRRLLVTLARTGGQPASALKVGLGRTLDATLKQLYHMRDAGFVLTQPDPADHRRMLYALAPSVPVVKTETGTVIDFGFCLLRL